MHQHLTAFAEVFFVLFCDLAISWHWRLGIATTHPPLWHAMATFWRPLLNCHT